MSHLSLPRIHFLGQMCANVPTANNDDIAQIVDVASVSIAEPEPGLSSAALRRRDQTFRQEMAQLVPGEAAIRAGWNYYGNSRCKFNGVTVISAQLDDGPLVTANSTNPDPIIGAAVQLGATVMVDVDPESILSTQIFCDDFWITAGSLSLKGKPTRFYSRCHNPYRNLAHLGSFRGAAVVWYGAISNDKLNINGPDSPVLAALHAAARAGQGLFIRLCSYNFRFETSPTELAQAFARGETPENPACGQLLGSIGPWLPGELASEGPGRRLFPNKVLFTDSSTPYHLGPALAQVDDRRQVVVLDLINTFPEVGDSLQKYNFGTVTLKIRTRENGEYVERVVGQLPSPPVDDETGGYRQTSYETGGGLAEIQYPPELEPYLATGAFRLYLEGDDHETLRETTYHVAIDEPGLYLEAGQTKAVDLHLFEQGQPAPAAVTVQLFDTTNFNKNNTEQIPVPAQPVEPARSAVVIENMAAGRDQIEVPAGGVLTLHLAAKRAGTCLIRFLPQGRRNFPLPRSFNTSFFMTVRVLPADAEVANLEPTFDNVYRHVLRYYYLLFPAMDRYFTDEGVRFDFSDEASMQAYAPDIFDRIQTDWHSAKYMPPTRDLSAGKRRLLGRWCALVTAPPET